WLGEQVRSHLNAIDWDGMDIVISDEGEQALETAGGIVHARPLLGDEPFWLVNGDVWSDFELQDLPVPATGAASLVVVDNPSHHPQGDFVLDNGLLKNSGSGQRVTYAGLGYFHPRFFDNQPAGVQPLGPLLRAAADNEQLAGVLHHGAWSDVGTPDRLAALDAKLSAA
ncbi:MAG: mannose-1-phosphate guanylyltransferase, partial [Gammaproteobacteria bacterium]|nr:mannose-1-phosphate guanylyltransferase [Gammaproteobacteria bacterium]